MTQKDGSTSGWNQGPNWLDRPQVYTNSKIEWTVAESNLLFTNYPRRLLLTGSTSNDTWRSCRATVRLFLDGRLFWTDTTTLHRKAAVDWKLSVGLAENIGGHLEVKVALSKAHPRMRWVIRSIRLDTPGR